MVKRINLNAKEIEIARNLCLARNGYICLLCKNPFSDKSVAEVHHIDGNPNNNPQNGSNWGLVHHSCNVIDNYIKKRMEAIDGERPPPFEYAVGTKMELRWIRWMIDTITKNQSLTWDEARYTGALESNCSPETTKRYLMKHVVDSDHPNALFKSTLDQGYNSIIKFTDHMKEFSDSSTEWK